MGSVYEEMCETGTRFISGLVERWRVILLLVAFL